MKIRQLRLFPPAKPLIERFGVAFFRGIPESPGVYVMSGERERILYVGQSVNLRARLNSYRHIPVETAPRRLVRLVHRVRCITWEICSNGDEAKLRENELLRLHKPTFNVMNTRPEHYLFVALCFSSGGIRLRLTKEPKAKAGEELFGAFKGLARVRRGIMALLRLLTAVANRIASPHDFPRGLLGDIPPAACLLPGGGPPFASSDSLEHLLRGFMSGQSDALLRELNECLEAWDVSCRFQRQFFDADLAALADFYEFGPARNRKLCEHFQLEKGTIPQTALDDLLVSNRRFGTTAGAPLTSFSLSSGQAELRDE